MNSAYSDFLSFPTFEKTVDTLFRFFIDTALIGYRHETGNGYKSAASELRIYLNTTQPHSEKIPVPETAQLSIKQQLSQSYLYWFDLRTDYWERSEPDEDLLDTVNPKQTLTSFQAEADNLKTRLTVAPKLAPCAPSIRHPFTLSYIRTLALLDLVIDCKVAAAASAQAAAHARAAAHKPEVAAETAKRPSRSAKRPSRSAKRPSRSAKRPSRSTRRRSSKTTR